MLFNVREFTFGTLYLDGILKFDPMMAETTIRATNIWARSGGLVAGSED